MGRDIDTLVRINEQVYVSYCYFYSKFHKSNYRRIQLPDRQLAMIGNFTKKLVKNYKGSAIGAQFLFDYMSYQFLKWYNIDSQRFGERNVQLSWIIGGKAYELWKNRDRQFDYQILSNRCVIDNKISLSELRIYLDLNQSHHHPNKGSIVRDDALRYTGYEKGAIFCASQNLFYDIHSSLCKRCRYKLECKI